MIKSHVDIKCMILQYTIYYLISDAQTIIFPFSKEKYSVLEYCSVLIDHVQILVCCIGRFKLNFYATFYIILACYQFFIVCSTRRGFCSIFMLSNVNTQIRYLCCQKMVNSIVFSVENTITIYFQNSP